MVNFIEIYKTANKSPEHIKLRECQLDYAGNASGKYTWYEYDNASMGMHENGIKIITTCAPWVSKDINNKKYNIVHNRPAYVEKMNCLERAIAKRILAYVYNQYMKTYI